MTNEQQLVRLPSFVIRHSYKNTEAAKTFGGLCKILTFVFFQLADYSATTHAGEVVVGL